MTEATPTTCRECQGAGYRLIDGLPSACPNCEAGQAWANQYQGGERWTSPHHLPPGGDVLLRRDAAEAAGLPPGAIGGDVPVRAMLLNDALVVDALTHLARVVVLAPAKDPAVVDAEAFLRRLPDGYRAALPVVERKSRRQQRREREAQEQAVTRAAPLEHPTS